MDARGLGSALARSTFQGLLWLGALGMVWSSSSYLELADEHPFFLEKLPLARPTLYLTALYAHVPSSLFALPACLALSSDGLRSRAPRLHRWLGRVTAALVLLAVVPSGFYLARFAQGGLVTTLGFWLTGALAAAAMLRSVQAARRGSFVRHSHYARHVTAQLAVAVLSRALLIGAELAELYEPWVYVASLWLPVLGSAAYVELSRSPVLGSPSKGSRHEPLAAARRVDAVR